MLGRPRLHEHAAPARAAPRSSCHLGDKLKRPLARAKIGKMQAGVGIHDTDDRDVRKIESLGDHLRAEQDVHVPAGHAVQNVVVRPLARGGIEVHPGDSGPRITHAHKALELLGAEATKPLGDVPTHRTRLGDWFLVAAVMAAQRRRRLVYGERNRALGTAGDVAAGGTLHERRETPAIEQQDDLLTAVERGPTATRRSPRRSARQASARSPSERPECRTATWSPKTPRTRATVWGVSAISGTRRIAPFPESTRWRSTCR